MAQDGDTIIYTFSNGSSELEDVSAVDSCTVDFLFSAGGDTGGTSGGSGGAVENAEIDLTNKSELYIFVSSTGRENGRYEGGVKNNFQNGGGSTEISFSNTDESDSDDEPFLVAAGGGGGGATPSLPTAGSGGAREGQPGSGGSFTPDPGRGVAPPLGGDGANIKANGSGTAGFDGDGAIDDQNRGLVTGGTITKGGGSPADTDGEVQISYQNTGPSKPTAPSGLTLTEQ
jgi:hypothetical protein